jgi:SAM-dependent methyltransferase
MGDKQFLRIDDEGYRLLLPAENTLIKPMRTWMSAFPVFNKHHSMREDEYRGMYELERSLWWYQGMREITASLLSNNLNGRNNTRVLDVGCGTGFSMKWLREQLKTEAVFGVDLFYEAAELWKLNDIHTAAVGSIEALPFPNSEFDLVTCFDVIYQLSNETAAQAVKEIARVLKPGGFFYIREPAYEWMRGSHDIVVATKHRFTRGRLKSLLTAHGLTVDRTTYANTLLFPLAVPHRFLSRVTGSEESDVKPVHPLLNRLFLSTLKLEARMMKSISLPFGLSVIALARK